MLISDYKTDDEVNRRVVASIRRGRFKLRSTEWCLSSASDEAKLADAFLIFNSKH